MHGNISLKRASLPCCTVSMILSLILLRKKLKGRQAVVDGRNSGQGDLGYIGRLLRIDWVGAFVFIAGGVLLLLALNWGSNEEWNSPKVIVCFILGGLLMAACLFWEWFLEGHQHTDTVKKNSSALFLAEPMIPLAIFTSYDVCAVLAASFVSGMVMIVMLYFVAIFMTIATGLSATNAGVQLLYFAPGMVSRPPVTMPRFILCRRRSSIGRRVVVIVSHDQTSTPGLWTFHLAVMIHFSKHVPIAKISNFIRWPTAPHRTRFDFDGNATGQAESRQRVRLAQSSI